MSKETNNQLPEDIQERLISGAMWERRYWEDWIIAIAEVGCWDAQIELLRQAGYLSDEIHETLSDERTRL
jgi:hypothetical protein